MATFTTNENISHGQLLLLYLCKERHFTLLYFLRFMFTNYFLLKNKMSLSIVFLLPSFSFSIRVHQRKHLFEIYLRLNKFFSLFHFQLGFLRKNKSFLGVLFCPILHVLFHKKDSLDFYFFLLFINGFYKR